MPSTPRLYVGTSASRNGSGSIGTSPSYPSKELLLPSRAELSLLGKEVSPFNGAGMRYDTSIVTDLHSEAKLKAAREADGQVPSTSQISIVGPRNDVKEEPIEQESLKEAVESLLKPCFKTSRTRAWEKSRRIEESEWMLSKEELAEQLRPEEEGLVPLNAIAGRMVLYGWQLFANQVEINASLSPLKRRKRIFDDALEARKQLIKLLVLVQWSKVAPELKTARSLIAFINDHFVQTDAAVNALAETRSILTNARLRNYDLITAIEALGTGGPQWVPPILKDVAQKQKPYTDAETIGLVRELEEAIRLRLACEEILPMPMTSYSISDGRARFKIPKLFEADLTLSGSGKEDRWWLLRVKFDFKVTGEGADRFPRQPKKHQRLNLLALADTELAPRSVAALLEQGAAVEETVGREVAPGREAEVGEDVEMGDVSIPLALDEQGSAQRRDAPLVRLYNMIQSQALQYWLDILHFQAVQQVKLGWGRRLSVYMETVQRTRALHITYWQRIDTEAQIEKDTWRPTASGKLIISVREKPKENGFEKVLKQLSTTAQEENSEHGRGQMIVRQEVHVDWDIQGPAADHLVNRKIVIDAQNLDARSLLLEITNRHSEASVKVIKSRLAASKLAKLVAIHQSTQITARGFTEHLLHLTLGEKASVVLRVDQMSGQIRLEQASDTLGSSSPVLVSHDWLNHLRETSTKINEKPDQIVSILQSLRSKIILEGLQEKSLLLGISVTTRMPLRSVDYAQLRARPGTLMYIPLKQCPSYYLVIHIGEESIRVALLCTGTFLEDLITSMRIVSLEWLDWQRVITSSAYKETSLGKRKREDTVPTHTFTKEELSKLYSYSVALICYHKVEQQLRAQNLSFVHVGGWTKLRPPPSSPGIAYDVMDAIVPSLCLNASKVLHSSNVETTNRNISIRLHQWWDPSKANVIISVKLKLKPGLVVKEAILETNREKIQYNLQSSVLSFSFRDIDNCLSLFVGSWRHIDRILDLNRELISSRQSDFFTIVECDMIKIKFTYAKDYLAEVQWVQNLGTQKGGYYAVSFESNDATDSKKNPHEAIKTTLARWLNSRDDSSATFWTRFLQILRQMLSLLEHVRLFSDNCFESVDCPELDIQDVNSFRLIFMNRYMLDVRLLTADNKVLFSDGARNATNATTSTSTIKDEFTIDGSSISSTRTSSTPSNAIPSLRSIIANLLSQYRQESAQNDAIEEVSEKEKTTSSTTSPVLIFSNGLLCPNQSLVVDWFLPRLIQCIQKAIE